MPLTDLGIDEARTYRPNVPEPDGFDSFWAETLDEYSGVPQDLTAVPFDNRQALIDTWDSVSYTHLTLPTICSV